MSSHLLDCVAIAVQRCTGMALRARKGDHKGTGCQSGVSGPARRSVHVADVLCLFAKRDCCARLHATSIEPTAYVQQTAICARG